MQDWEDFSSRIDALPEEELLERSADELLRRLEGLGVATGTREAKAQSANGLGAAARPTP